MIVTDTELTSFIDIIKKDYGISLSKNKAIGQAINLVLLFETLAKRRLDNSNLKANNDNQGASK